MGLLFAADTSDDDFVPPPGLGMGKDKSHAVLMDGVIDSPESVGASSSTNIYTCAWSSKCPSQETPTDVAVVRTVDLLPPLQVQHAQAEDALYADRHVGR
jgi:hypothetical protein